MKRKGTTLVELMISLAIASSLLMHAGDILLRHVSYENEEKNRAKEDFYADETFLYIEKLMHQPVEVEVKDHAIYVRSATWNGKKKEVEFERHWIIFYPDKKVLGMNCEGKDSSKHDPINKDICNFHASMDEKARLMYISYETSSGRRFERCIPMNSP